MRRVEPVAAMQRELVERAMAGDLEAFTQIADASMDRLYAAATLILRDRDGADDAAQEALISAWRDMRSLRNPDAFEAWLHRLLVWACYRVARKERRRSAVELRVLPSAPSEARDPSEAIVDRDRLARGLGGLPMDQRVVVVLHYYLDRPAPQVAEILGVPVGTVKSRLQRGLVALRSAMDAEPEAQGRQIREGVA